MATPDTYLIHVGIIVINTSNRYR